MKDPHCGWNIRTNRCENIKSNSNLVNLNLNLCSRLERQENIKSVEIESGSALLLECNIKDEYLFGLIEWKKDQIPLSANTQNVYFTWNKDLIIMNGNASYNGIYNCYADKNELLSSYSVTFKSGLIFFQILILNNFLLKFLDIKTNVGVSSSGQSKIN